MDMDPTPATATRTSISPMTVQDVTATVSYILKDKDNMIPNFGFAEADVNYNNNVEIADVIGHRQYHLRRADYQGQRAAFRG